jgi:hypothetical protein
MIPVAALTVAGVLDVLLRAGRFSATSWTWSGTELPRHAWRHPVRTFVAGLAVAAMVVFAATAWGPWRHGIEDLWYRDSDGGKAAALSYVVSTTSADDVLVVDDAFWVDLVRAGHPQDKVIWFTKLNVDRDVKLPGPHPWRAIDYVLIDQQDALSVHLNSDWTPSPSTLTRFPTLGKALKHSAMVASFGTGLDRAAVFRVDRGPVETSSSVAQTDGGSAP